jgi:hypothetical protein
MDALNPSGDYSLDERQIVCIGGENRAAMRILSQDIVKSIMVAIWKSP